MDEQDAKFVDRALAYLPAVSPPPDLAARLLAGFAARGGLWARFCEKVWPGLPVWAPVSAFAAAVALGVMLGAVLPTMGDEGAMGFSLEQPSAFSLDAGEDL